MWRIRDAAAAGDVYQRDVYQPRAERIDCGAAIRVLDTGTRKIVYLARPNGVFEAREVAVGAPPTISSRSPAASAGRQGGTQR